MIPLLLLAGLAFDAEVGRLGDPDAIVRYQARIALARAGDEAVPALRRGLESKDPEVRRETARLLDGLARRSLAGRRGNPEYVIPSNKMTGNVAKWKRQQVVFVGHLKYVRHFAPHYRGVLNQWGDPTLADYNRLLLSLSSWLDKTCSADPLDRFEAHLAAMAIAWKLEQLEPGVGQSHWSTRWFVQRELLPSVQRAAVARGSTATETERDLFLLVLAHVRPLCDRKALPMHRRLRARFEPRKAQ